MNEPCGWLDKVLFCWFVSLFNLFFFFYPKQSSKHLWEGYYNLFTVTALKHIALYYSIYCTLDFFDIKWLSENIICYPPVCHWFCSILEITRGWRVLTTCWKLDMHAHMASHLLHPKPSQACISLFTNLPFQCVRPYSEAMTFTWSTGACVCLCFSPSACRHKPIHSQCSSQTHAWARNSHSHTVGIIVKSDNLESLLTRTSSDSILSRFSLFWFSKKKKN